MPTKALSTEGSKGRCIIATHHRSIDSTPNLLGHSTLKQESLRLHMPHTGLMAQNSNNDNNSSSRTIQTDTYAVPRVTTETDTFSHRHTDIMGAMKTTHTTGGSLPVVTTDSATEITGGMQ